MAIKITYTAKGHPGLEGERFVRACHPSGYAWCIRGLELRYDIQQGTCDAEDLPQDVREAADRRLGHAFSYVAWPSCPTTPADRLDPYADAVLFATGHLPEDF